MPYLSSTAEPASNPVALSIAKGNSQEHDHAQAIGQQYTLFTFRYSLRSLMVRYARSIAMAKKHHQSAAVVSRGGLQARTDAEEALPTEEIPSNKANSVGENHLPVRQPERIPVPEALVPEEKTEQDMAREMEIREVNIHRGENCEEWFLCGVNPKGQVPVLQTPTDDPPLASALFITLRLAHLFPDPLLPPQHTASIVDLLGRLHSICFESLSFRAEECAEDGGLFRNGAVDLLLSEKGREKLGVGKGEKGKRWERSLEAKRDFHDAALLHSLDAPAVTYAIKQAKEFFDEYTRVRREFYPSYSGAKNEESGDRDIIPWTFGPTIGPTALDAHVVAFVARLRDADLKAIAMGLQGRYEELVPEEVRDFAERACNGVLWREVTPGKDGERDGKTF